jgi:hypothetical protein
MAAVMAAKRAALNMSRRCYHIQHHHMQDTYIMRAAGCKPFASLPAEGTAGLPGLA